jgi:hypothetical protein
MIGNGKWLRSSQAIGIGLSLLVGLFSSVNAYADDLQINGVSMEDYAKNEKGERFGLSSLGFVLNEDVEKGRFLTSLDGRYVIVGDFKIYDRFARTQPTTIEQVKNSQLFFKLDALGINKDDFVMAKYGDEKLLTLVFADPGDPAYLESMSLLKAKVDKKVIGGIGLVVVGNSETTRAQAMKVYCGFKEDRDGTLKTVLSGKMPEGKVCLPGNDLMKGQLINVYAGNGQTPVAITHEGRVYSGEAFKMWIK